MFNPRLTRWKDLERTRGLLLFAQRLEELLFDYTLDSYKAPALNTHTRLLELRSAIQDVSDGVMREGALVPMLEELSWSIRDDSAAKALLGRDAERYAEVSGWPKETLAGLLVHCNHVESRLEGRYEPEILKQLEAILPNAAEKERLLALTTSLAVEWTYEGFSRDYIYYRTRGFFFGFSRDPIMADHQLKEFLAYFPRKSRKWAVVFRASRAFSKLKSVFPDRVASIALVPPQPKTAIPTERRFLQPDVTKTWVTIPEVEALDARSARRDGEKQLTFMTNLVRYHVHRTLFDWDSTVLVYDDVGRPIVLKGSPSPILKYPDCPLSELEGRLRQTLASWIKADIPKGSLSRFTAALNLHASAVLSRLTETQLFSLWAALESLLPLSEGESRISQIADLSVPVLARHYPRKLLLDLHASLTECAAQEYTDVLRDVGSEKAPLRGIAIITCIEGNEPLRDRLYAATNLNPLLRHRIFQVKKALSDSASIRKAIAGHEMRVGWHLRRIYRSRNLLSHRGRKLPYYESIVESLHSYVDQMLALLEEVLARSPAPRDIDGALLAVRLDHEAHVAALAKARNVKCTMENIESLVFGPDVN